MLINLSNAIKKFYPNPVLEQVYFEAIANSIYANANEIELLIEIESYSKPETLKMTIKDNGDGFDELNFKKFSKLLETEDEEHKGLGRLVFINYFKNIEIVSDFDNKRREFSFTEQFEGKEKDFKLTDYPSKSNETTLVFTKYLKDKVYQYDYLIPTSIKKAIELHFFPLFHQFKKTKRELTIKIELKTNEPNHDKKFYSDKKQIIVSQIPTLEVIEFPAEFLSLHDKMELYYSINNNELETSIITAICAEGRTIPLDIISKENMPNGYEIIFLLYSDYFNGKVNNSRQKLDIDQQTWKTIKNILINRIGEVFKTKIPSINKRNEEIKGKLIEKYPHYYGFFDDNSLGLINRDKSLEIAQKKFFKAQREILEAQTLSDEQYEQSIGISSRLLTEYILYRNLIINKLKKIDKSKQEDVIHNLIVPKETVLHKKDFVKDIYKNNVWLLDDKFMTYSTILSEKRMDDLIKEITQDEKVKNEAGRPDISMIFSDSPNQDNIKVDVVIVELKKIGRDLAGKEELVSQLKQRARRLINYYPNKIQRIWFYGIIDFTKEFETSLKESKYFEIFSKDKAYYGEETIMSIEDNSKSILIGINLLSFEAFWQDAESRNATFLRILKNEFKQNE